MDITPFTTSLITTVRGTGLATLATLTAMVCLTACGTRVEFGTPVDADDVAAGDDTVEVVAGDGGEIDRFEPVTDGTIALPDGSWEMVGYGTVLTVEGDRVDVRHLTRSTCAFGGDLDNELDVDHASSDGTVITLDLVGPTTDYRLRPLLDTPECDGPSDPVTALTEVFTAHYPFAERRRIDLAAEMDTIRATVDDDPDALIDALEAFMVRLGDGHTTVNGLGIEPDPSSFGIDGVDDVAQLGAVMDAELDATLAALAEVNVDPTGNVAWGSIAADPDTGYLLLPRFYELSDDGDPVADRDALVAALDVAVADLADDVDRVVVDMRFNEGGHEDLAVAVAGYFVDAPTEAYRKWAHGEPDPIAQTIVVEPQAVRFDGPVAVLTSPVTASAAEAFGLAMREVAGAIVVGNPSFGEFSDAIDWSLPDGTEFTMSMEVYTDLEGIDHEAHGLPVDVPAPFDEAVTAAVDALAGNRGG